MQNQLSKQPFYIILIPIFFVLHGVKENFGFIDFKDAVLLMLTYSAGSILLFLFFFIFFKDKIKTSLFAGWLITGYFFYGAIQDFFKDHMKILSKYSILLSILLISTVILFIFFKRSRRNFSRVVLFLNVIFLIYVTIDLTSITIKSINPPANKFSIFPFDKTNTYAKIGNYKKPDIYFLLFDEYASSLSLKQNYNYENDLDSFLIQRGFQIQQKSYSNYNETPLSMASILNMSYLQGVNNKIPLTVDDYAYCQELIKNNETIKFLSSQEYNIINYSVFDLAGNPSPIKQTILPLKTRLITDNTLLSRIYRDMGWMLYTGPFGIKSLFINRLLSGSHNNDAILDSVTKQSGKISARPIFIYAHIYMPHDPFFFDKKGNQRNIETIFTELGKPQNISTERNSKFYLEYLEYTNSKIKTLINTIQSNTKNNAVIILMGDHGFREHLDLDVHHNFQNMNAVYFPGKDYHLLYDSISGVNQFRVIFNTLFDESFPLLKDSTIFF